jgi:hypothetical protein
MLRPISRTLAGLALAGSLLVFPVAQITQAAPANPGATGAQRAHLPLSLSYIASVEGVTPQVLQQDLQAGQTLLQIAQAAHSQYASSAQMLATALLAPVKSRMDEAVSAHRITQAQENQRYDALLAGVTKLVATPHPQQVLSRSKGPAGAAGGTARGHGMLGLSAVLAPVATACHTTPAALQTAIHAGGKSLLAICQSTNSSIQESDLVSVIINVFKTRLDAAVKAGYLSASQENKLLAAMTTRIETVITTPLPAGMASPAA